MGSVVIYFHNNRHHLLGAIFLLLFIRVDFSIGDIIDIDSDLDYIAGWGHKCDGGYHNLENFVCDGDNVIPPIDYQRNVGFWSKCPEEAILTCSIIYEATTIKAFNKLSISAYFNGTATITIEIRTPEGYPTEEIYGSKWQTVDIDLSIYEDIQEITITPEFHSITQYTVIDKIVIDDEIITTTVATTSASPVTTPATTNPSTPTTTGSSSSVSTGSSTPVTTGSSTPPSLGPSSPTTSGPTTPTTPGPSTPTTSSSSTPTTSGSSSPVSTGFSTPVTTGSSTPTSLGPSSPTTSGPSTPTTSSSSSPTTSGPSSPVSTGSSTPVTTGSSTPASLGPSSPTTSGPSIPTTSSSSTPTTTGSSSSVSTGSSTPVTTNSSTPTSLGPSSPTTSGPSSPTISSSSTPTTTGSSIPTTSGPSTPTTTNSITPTTTGPSSPTTNSTDFSTTTILGSSTPVIIGSSTHATSTPRTTANTGMSSSSFQSTDAETSTETDNPFTFSTTDRHTNNSVTQIPPKTNSVSDNSYYIPIIIITIALLILLTFVQCCFTCFKTADKKDDDESSLNDEPYARFVNEPNETFYGYNLEPNATSLSATALGPGTKTIAYNFNQKPEVEINHSEWLGRDNGFMRDLPISSTETPPISPTSPTFLIEPIYSKASRPGPSSIYAYGMDPAQDYFPRLARTEYTYGKSPDL